MSTDRIRLTLIGAGIYARDAHAPSLRALADHFEVKSIYSRTEANARALAETFDYPIDTTSDLEALLARDDIDAVDVLLPIERIPDVVEQALEAGKHVISEKPTAPDLVTGRRLLAHKSRFPDQVWMVAEQYRYEPAYNHAARLLIEGAIGRVITFQWMVSKSITPESPYYHTSWRQTPAFQGGYLLDAGVHHAAALRMIFGEAIQVSAAATSIQPDLPPLDTLNATLTFQSGVIGNYGATFASKAPWQGFLNVIGDEGVLRVDRPELIVERPGMEPQRQQMWEVHERSTVTMLRDFAEVVRGEKAQVVSTPEQCLQDVALIEALLRAAATRQTQAVERIV
ncbi:MAG: Gfo/Idh/MocA family oxidoreductase [Anaerolineae bacterium]|nr:Gfo/Idh/MocA family oxidoreductase [Anaerolineae bacterium]